MHHAIGNVMRFAGISLRDAVMMATRNPARVGRVSGRQRGLTPGERGDLVRFRESAGVVEILEVWMSGRPVWGGPSGPQSAFGPASPE